MADCIVDASVTLNWLFGEDRRSQWILRVFASGAPAAPWLWGLEVVNAVLVQERRKQITQNQGTQFLQILEALDIEIMGEPMDRDMEKLALLARPHQLTAYDALYLDLAINLGLPLCTMDRNLKNAANRLGIRLIHGSKQKTK